jgi:hypothetical protein
LSLSSNVSTVVVVVFTITLFSEGALSPLLFTVVFAKEGLAKRASINALTVTLLIDVFFIELPL